VKVLDWRSRAVETRSVTSARLRAPVVELELLLLVGVEVFCGAGKRAAARVSTERPVAAWQRVPSASMPQMPRIEG
jgi:hypothetical protein